MTAPSKRVRFTSMNTLYSLLSPPTAIAVLPSTPTEEDKKAWIQPRPRLQSTPAPNPHVALPPVVKTPSASSHTSRASSKSNKLSLPDRPSSTPPISSSSSSHQRHYEPSRHRKSSSLTHTPSSSTSNSTLHRPRNSLPPPRTSSSSSESEDMRLHQLLAFSPHRPRVIPFDLSLSPDTFLDRFSRHTLREPATDPKVPHLTITCPQLLWPIQVVPLHSKGYVTVIDVLVCLYYGLRTTVHRVEYDAQLKETLHGVNQAYFARCAKISSTRARREEELGGVKRVDFLYGRNIFLGLMGTVRNSNVWELNVTS